MQISKSRLVKRLSEFNKGKDYHKQIKPSNFGILGFARMINPEMVNRKSPWHHLQILPRMQFMTIFFIIMTKTCPISRKRILEITLGYDRGISGHPESKFDGNVGVLERKHVIVTDIRHIGKESDTLNEPFGLDEFRYEF